MATTNYGWTLPTVGGSEDTWGDDLNTLWTDLDTLLGGVSATEFAILDGATVTTAELNTLDGITATTAELNKLDGVTVSTAEINYLSGVTGDIQGQIDGKISGVTAGTGLSGGGPSGSVTLNGVTQSTATWEAGTSTTEGIVSPAKNKAAFDAFEQQIGVDQTWTDKSNVRSSGTTYQNTTGRPIAISVTKEDSFGGIQLFVSSDGSNFVLVAESRVNDDFRSYEFVFTIVPDGHFYRALTGAPVRNWAELR